MKSSIIKEKDVKQLAWDNRSDKKDGWEQDRRLREGGHD